MLAVPSKETPCIVLAVSSAVAVAALPVVSWYSMPKGNSSLRGLSWYAWERDH